MDLVGGNYSIPQNSCTKDMHVRKGIQRGRFSIACNLLNRQSKETLGFLILSKRFLVHYCCSEGLLMS